MSESFTDREKRISQIRERLQKLESKQKKQARDRDTRRLILLGRMMENYLKWGRVSADTFQRDLDAFLTRNYDRDIFGLPPLAEKARDKKPPERSPEQTAKNTPAPSARTRQESPPPSSPAKGRKLPEKGVSVEEFMG
jgi:large subunit ribosomal protein L7/L12